MFCFLVTQKFDEIQTFHRKKYFKKENVLCLLVKLDIN